MAVYLSPGVFVREIDLSVVPTATGALTPAFIGTAKKGPVQKPTFISNSQQFIETFGEPFPESYLGYAVLAYFEEGARAWVLRAGVELSDDQPEELARIAIDTSGARGPGWGRIALFTGIDYGKICTRVISELNPIRVHRALFSDIIYNDIDTSSTYGPTSATLNFQDMFGYTGPVGDQYTVLITSDTVGGALINGATFEIIRNSDGATVINGVLSEPNPGVSQVIDAGDGVVFTVNASGSSPIGANDTFTFSVQPDTRKFAFKVDLGSTNIPTEYILPVPNPTDTVIYNTAEEFAVAINNLLGGDEDYKVISQKDGTVCFTTNVAGYSIQLQHSEAFAINVGQVLYAYDIPRSFLQSTNSGPYNITTSNNRVNMDVVSQTESVNIEFNLPVGMNQAPEVVASNVNVAGVKHGERYWTSYVIVVPGGFKEVVIEASADHELDQLKMNSDLSHFKTLRFAEELDIQYPYTRAYRVYQDSRVLLPMPGTITPSQPLSCEQDPLSAECAADSSYFQNIVGWFVASSAGTWIDKYSLTLSVTTQNSQPAPGIFSIAITDSNGQVVDAVDNVSFDQRNDRYVGNVLNPGSKYGGTYGNSYVQWIPRPSFLNNDPVNDPANYEVRVPGAYARKTFAGGQNGIPDDPAFSSELDRAIIGNPAKESGIYAFQNPEVYDITLLIIPGVSSGAVIGQGLQMCEARGDCMMIVDPPFGLRPQEVVTWHNGMLFSDLAQAINSSYGALYHPWLKIFDQFSGNTIFIPPSGHVSSVYARTEDVAETWFAPAGVNRGHLLTPLDTEVDLSIGERDLMYGMGNAVNPIVNFPQDGITVWGQRTLQRKQSALDRVNVRLLLIFIKKNAVRFLRQFVFEPNDAITRARVVNVSNPFLADIQSRRGLTGFKVVCDETNNTPERIDRNELHVAYFLKPTRAAEFIQLNLVVMRTEASFASAEVLAAGGIVTPTTAQ